MKRFMQVSWLLIAAVMLSSCGKELDDYNRHLLALVAFGNGVTLKLRQDSGFAFDETAHCIQLIDYRDDDGESQGRRLEIFNVACNGSQVLASENRIQNGRLELKDISQNTQEFSNGKAFGRISQNGSTFSMTAFCEAADTIADATQYAPNCDYDVSSGKLTSVTAQ